MKSLKINLLALFFLGLLQNGICQFDLSTKMALGLDACTYLKTEDAIVFFNGDAVQYYSLVEENEPAFSSKSISGFPEWEVVSAALPWNENEMLLFQDQKYVVYNVAENAITEEGDWEGLPAEWEGGLDAACQWGDDTYMFFYGREVVSYNVSSDTYQEPDLIENWEGWPTSWATGIDSAANVGSGVVYFFRGPAYVAYDMESGIFEKPIKTSSK